MNAHEVIDRFLARSPRYKITVTASVLAAIAGVLLLVFFAGARHGTEQADSKYLRERDDRMAQIAAYERNAAQLGAENALLKKQNEVTAGILKANDAKIAGDATKFAELLTERNKRYEDIDLDSNFDSQLCGLCSDLASSGFGLSDATCGRCKAAAKAGR
jgi:hypothetical protein